MGTLAKLSFLTVSIGLGYLMVAQFAGDRPTGRPMTAAEGQAYAAPATTRPAPAPPTWSYSDGQDEMGQASSNTPV